MKYLKHIKRFNESDENLKSDVSDSSFEFPSNYPNRGIDNNNFIPYKDSEEDKEDMSLEEKILKMNLNINKVNLTPLQMEVVIGAMKDLTTQRKNGNWSNKIR